jgi:hypothetical protein
MVALGERARAMVGCPVHWRLIRTIPVLAIMLLVSLLGETVRAIDLLEGYLQQVGTGPEDAIQERFGSRLYPQPSAL